jgi:hypothetical protein
MDIQGLKASQAAQYENFFIFDWLVLK